MATLLHSLKLAFGSSRTPLLPGFTNSSSVFVVKPCVTFVVPNRWPPGYTDGAMLRNVLASSSKEDLKNLMKDASKEDLENLMEDAQLGKLKLPSSQLFEICCKLYDKSYTSHLEKLYRLSVFEDNLKGVMSLNKMQNDRFNDGTLRLAYNLRDRFDRTSAERRRVNGRGLLWRMEDLKNLMKDASKEDLKNWMKDASKEDLENLMKDASKKFQTNNEALGGTIPLSCS